MNHVTISELLAVKPVCILCPTFTEYRKLISYLVKWQDLEWKSGMKVVENPDQWNVYITKTVYFIHLRPRQANGYKIRGKKYYMTFSTNDDEDVMLAHIFTVSAFIDYIIEQGASCVVNYVLD